METTRIAVDNIHCGGCGNSIQNTLSKIEGVGNVQVNVDEKLVIVEHPIDFDLNLLIDQLTKMGYPKAGQSTSIQRAKSYVSCLIGRL